MPALLASPSARAPRESAARRHLVDVPRYRTVASVDDSSKKKIWLSRQLPRRPCSALSRGHSALRKLWTTARRTITSITLAKTTSRPRRCWKLLPASIPIPSAFEHVGHVAHLNLRPEHDPYKALIGEVLLDKVANVRTVVNKIGEIATEYRTYELEVLGGDPSTQVELREQDCLFRFDVRDVYWNSRLQSEHARLSPTIPREARVADCTCGVGLLFDTFVEARCSLLRQRPESRKPWSSYGRTRAQQVFFFEDFGAVLRAGFLRSITAWRTDALHLQLTCHWN